MVERHEVEHLQIARRRHQRAVEVIGHPVQEIHRAEVRAQRFLQVRLQLLVLRAEQFGGLLRTQFLFGERQVQFHQAAHLVPEAEDVFIGDMLSPELAIHATGQGVVDLEHFVREQVARRPLSQKTQRTNIGPPAFRVIIADELHAVREEQLKVQLLELMVHQGRQHGIFLPGFGIDNRLGGNDRELLPYGKLVVFSVVNAGNRQCFHYFSLRDRPKPPERAIRTVRTSADVTVLCVMV